jgi:hypothetical protein
MKKIISFISLVLVILSFNLCYAEESKDDFLIESQHVYSLLKDLGTNIDIGINYPSYKEEFRKAYVPYNNYIQKNLTMLLPSYSNDPEKLDKDVCKNIAALAHVYKALDEVWYSYISTRSTDIKKISWIWNEFPELASLHRDWLGGYDTKAVMRIILETRPTREANAQSALDARSNK